MITHISHVVLYAADQEASLAFYVQQLGFEWVRDEQMFPGARWTEIVPPGGQTTVVISDAAVFEKSPGEGAFFHLACDDAQATHTQLAAAGVQLSEVRTEPWGTFFTAADPDGNQVMITQQH